MELEKLEKALKIDRAGFIKGLIAAGYKDMVVYNATKKDIDLLRLASEMYADIWDTFDIYAFESWNYVLNKMGDKNADKKEHI